MSYETSYGIIPLKKKNDEWHVLLIQHGSGHWSFPKGHPEEGETPTQTAARELHEETGLVIVRMLFEKPLKEHYVFTNKGRLVHKSVYYYLAEVKGQVKLQEAELQDSLWVPLKEADQKVTFPQAAHLCQQAQSLISDK